MKNSVLTVGSISLPHGLEAIPAGDNSPGNSPQIGKYKIEYIRQDIPHFEVPSYRGARYEETTPDTLDIAERAELCINCLTSATDDQADYEIYDGEFGRNPPVLVAHSINGWCRNCEGMMEGLPLLRVATGSALNDQVDPVWMGTLLKGIGPDGLLYIPLVGTPWSRLQPSWIQPVWRADGTATDTSNESVTQFTAPFLWPRAIAAMTVYYLRDQNPMWTQTIEGMIQRMLQLATNEYDYSFFPAGGYEPNAKLTGPGVCDVMPLGCLAVEHGNGRLIQGLAQYYRVTGYEPAQALAGRLVNFLRGRAHYYDAQGRFLWSYTDINPSPFEGEPFGGSAHSHCIGLLGVLEYAAAVRDQELLEWVRSSYEWARTQGAPLVGYCPEYTVHNWPRCETCPVADLIGIAIKLSTAGVGDYWDDVDRCVRNQFAENQLTETEWVYRMAEDMPKKPVVYSETADRAVERNVGGFGYPGVNQWGTQRASCCTGNSSRALYYIWEHIVQQDKGQLSVNLLLNRASKWADVHSYIPYEGRVDLHIKQSCESVRVRVPEWVESNSPQVACKINGVSRQFNWEGRYVNAGAGREGETLVMTFPIGERTGKEKMGGAHYSVVIRGTTVVSIDPPGKYGAFYQRASYREGKARWKKVKRFAPEQEIRW